MLYGIYASAAGALANSYRQDVIANNLANVETVAFKRDLALFQTRPTESAQRGSRKSTAPILDGIGGGMFALPTHTDFSPSSLDRTDRSLDVALAQPGFFRVQNGSQINYTRDGRFAVDQQGQLVTQTEQLPVLDENNGPIIIDRTRPVLISDSGLISQAGQELTRLAVVDFDDPTVLRKQGNNLYVGPASAEQPALSQVKQGFLETSGVRYMDSMIDMIRTSRLFEQNLNMMKLQDHTLGSALQQLGRIT